MGVVSPPQWMHYHDHPNSIDQLLKSYPYVQADSTIPPPDQPMKFRKKSFHLPPYIDDLHPTKSQKISPNSEHSKKQHTVDYKYSDKASESFTHSSSHIPPQNSISHNNYPNPAKKKSCISTLHQSNHSSKIMEPSQNNREIGWSDSSDSEAWQDVEDMGDTQNHNIDDILTNTIFCRGPVIQLDTVSLERNRVLWRHCLVGYLLDRRCFSARRMQSILNSAWRLRGSIRIVGRQGNYYIIHFEYPTDQEYILREGPWSVGGALLVVEQWTPKLALNRIQLTFFTAWVQVRYEADSQSSPTNLSNNQLPGAPQPLNNHHQTNLYQQPSNQPPQTNNQSHLG